MSIKKLNNKLIILGTGLFASIKYEIFFDYSVFDFLELKAEKEYQFEKKIEKALHV